MIRSAIPWILGILCLGSLIYFVFDWIQEEPILVVSASRGPAVQSVYATGVVEAEIMLPLRPKVAGRLLSLLVDEGDTVLEGQVLAVFDDAELQKTIEELAAREDFTRRELSRQEKLLKERVSSKEAYERALLEFRSAFAAKQAAEVRARDLRIFAPGNGEIIRRDGEVGELFQNTEVVFWFAGEGDLRVTAEVDEEDISSVKVGQKVLIRSDAYPGQIFSGRVQSITPKGDPIARSYRVRIALRDEVPLKIGMTVENNIIIRESDSSVLVPSSAVLQDAVWLLRNGRLAKQPIEVGARGVAQIEVLSGLQESETVVLEPTLDLKEGQSVNTRLLDQGN